MNQKYEPVPDTQPRGRNLIRPALQRFKSECAHLWSPWFLLMLLCLVAAGVQWTPLEIDFRDIEQLRIDRSAFLVLDAAFLRGDAFGVDIIHPYGPLAFIKKGTYTTGIQRYVIAMLLLVCVTLAVALWRLVRYAGIRHPLLLLLIILLAAWLVKVHMAALLTACYALLNLNRFVDERERSNLATVLLTVTGAMVALVTFQYFVLFVVQLAVITAADALRRKWPVTLSIGMLSFLCWWFLAGQGLANLLPWISTSLDLSASFGETLSRSFLEPARLAQVLAFIVSALVICQCT